MLPDIPHMYDCYMASLEDYDEDRHVEAYYIQVEKRLKRPLTAEERVKLEDLYNAKFPDTHPFLERHDIPF